MSGHTVLVVDDEPALRLLLSRYLSGLGYGVETAATGEIAWKAVQENPHRFQAFLIDLVLPGGDELAARIVWSQVGARILLCSGYQFEPAHPRVNGSRLSFLQKPFVPSQLAEELGNLFLAE